MINMPVSKPPSVSVVMPTYNHARYISRALDSILNQNFSNFEVIVIDNYSKDNTEKIVAKFNDPRIRYFKINNDGIIAKSRNLGIQKARAEWIAFLDSDDWWTNDKLTSCMARANNNVDVMYHTLKIVPSSPMMFWKNKIRVEQLRKPALIDLLVIGNVIPNSSVVIRKRLLLEINGLSEKKNLIGAEDYHSWLKVATLTEKFLLVPGILGYYAAHNESISNKDMSLPSWCAVKEFIDILSPKQKVKVESHIRYTSGRFKFLNNDFDNATKDLSYAFRHGRIGVKIKSLFMLAVKASIFQILRKQND